MRELLDSLPLWNVLLGTVVIVLIAIEAGYRIGRWRNQHVEFESEALLSSMTGAHLALLAFIMAFSFSMAAGHYDKRRQVLLEEVNAIDTAHLRTQLLEGAEARELEGLLVDYARLRARGTSVAEAMELVEESNRLQARIWEAVQDLIGAQEITIVHSLVIQSVNEVFDVHEKRVTAALRNRVPSSLWLILICLLGLSMVGIGYFSGRKGRRNPIASTGLALSFSLVLFLIADLDRPTSGLVQADLSILAELDAKLSP